MESSTELSINPQTSQIYMNEPVVFEEPPEETGTDAIADISPDQVLEEDGIEGFRRDFISRLWMTYRKEFPTMNDTNFTSDCGWGCMIRSGQMLLAQGFIMHFLGRTWRWDDRNASDPILENTHRKIIRWFGDTPSRNTPFSIHTLVNLGKQSGKKPGDWYGPSSVAHLLRQAVRNSAKENVDFDRINVYVAQDCAVYIQDIIDECTVPITSPSSVPWKHNSHESDWKSLILLVPLRLGQDKLNPIYNECLKAMLSLDNCIGIIGGRPRHSLYFIGYQEDKLIHLDPHYCQDMVDVTQDNFNMASFHCKSPRKMKMTKMDPCCCIGFYCRTKDKFLEFVESVQPFLLPTKQSSSSAHYNDITYPMFVFCKGKSSEQQREIPPRLSFGSDCSYLDESNLYPNLEDDEDDDEIVEFVVV